MLSVYDLLGLILLPECWHCISIIPSTFALMGGNGIRTRTYDDVLLKAKLFRVVYRLIFRYIISTYIPRCRFFVFLVSPPVCLFECLNLTYASAAEIFLFWLKFSLSTYNFTQKGQILTCLVLLWIPMIITELIFYTTYIFHFTLTNWIVIIMTLYRNYL